MSVWDLTWLAVLASHASPDHGSRLRRPNWGMKSTIVIGCIVLTLCMRVGTYFANSNLAVLGSLLAVHKLVFACLLIRSRQSHATLT